MKTALSSKKRHEQGSIVAYFVVVLVFLSAIAAVATYVSRSVDFGHRRSDMIRASQYAQSGALIGSADLEKAFTNKLQTFFDALQSQGYMQRQDLAGTKNKVYQRQMMAPFSNQMVNVVIWMTNATPPPYAKVVATAKTGKVTQTNILNVKMSFGFGAAIISDSPGSTGTGTDKGTGQDGNVAINGDKNGPLVIDGGADLAVLANGRVNVDTNYANVPISAISSTNYNTANQVPDYTLEGSTDQLFDFKRFIAVADVAGTHYTNLTKFATACSSGAFLEGVIVVDFAKTEDLSPTDFPKGINVHGTLVFNFGPLVKPGDKCINTVPMNINPANLTGMNPKNPKTYTTGYPPVYINPAKHPANVDITSKGFQNFSFSDDLPALMYNIGILDIHGPANICGALYTPSFVEIENKADGQTQYFKGTIIAGGGVYIENLKHSSTVVSFDRSAIDCLATSGSKGKRIFAMYWE